TRGALIRGLDGSFVKDQIARRHYGISVYEKYQEGKVYEKSREWHATEEMWVVYNQMRWFAEKGMVLEEDKTVPLSVYRVIFEGTSLIFSTEILACNKDKRPSWNDPNAVFT
ncbi:hypothetical protein RUND412_011472, partial [Rhizina undulata]